MKANRSSLIVILLFFIACNFSLHAEIIASKIFYNSFDSFAGWQNIGTGSSIKLDSSGYKGGCLNLDFSLDQKSTWVVIARQMDGLELPAGFEMKFKVKAKCPAENIEIKFIDKDGNVFWAKLENFSFNGAWQDVSVSRSDFSFAWGPNPQSKLSRVERVEIALSIGSAAKGSVSFDELEIVESAKPKVEEVLSIKAVSSSNQDDINVAANAVDGNMKTRWSSPFSDPQALTLEMDKEINVAGVIIYWESAFGKSYDIQLSKDGKKWNTAFSTEDGNGGSDIIYFKPQSARYVRIFGRVRGTSWGYSIYEVKIVKKEDLPVLTASAGQESVYQIIDGDMSTVWRDPLSKPAQIVIDLQKSEEIGGLVIYWDGNSPEKRTIQSSPDGKNWTLAYTSKKMKKNEERIFFENLKTRYLKIIMEGGEAIIKDISFRGPDEKASPELFFQNAAVDAGKGLYPMWLSKEQEYWTITGVVDDNEESLLSETGSVEPYHNCYSFMPLLDVDGKMITSADVTRVQSLEDACLPLPTVRWQGKNFDFKIDSFSSGAGGKSSTWVEYVLTNKSLKEIKGSFNLLLRPFQVNPPWMHGGLARIEKIEYNSLVSKMMDINGKPGLFVPVPPDRNAVVPMKRSDSTGEQIQGDIAEEIVAGRVKGKTPINLTDPDGFASACLAYDYALPAHGVKRFQFIIPLHGTDSVIDQNIGANNAAQKMTDERSIVKKFWSDKLSTVRISVPEKEFMDTLKANLAYVLINDDSFRLQPGSRNYDSSWTRDGSLTARALLVMDCDTEVKRYLDWLSKFIKDDGWIPFIISNKDEIETHGWKEFDSQGEYIYAILQYYLFTGDKAFLADKKEKIIKDLVFMDNLRAQRSTSEYQSGNKKAFYGIFPESASHEGYIDPPRHSYWDDFWGLKGYKDASTIFGILDDQKNSKMAGDKLNVFRKTVRESMDVVAKAKKLDYLPACAELGDLDPTSTASGVWPCGEMKSMNPGRMTNTFNKYWKQLQGRFEADWKGGFTPYELRNANPFIMMGTTDRLHSMITNFFTWKRPRAWNHWAEVVLSDYRMAQYLGDMPHTWIGAEYINVIRNMLIIEDNKELNLFKGVPIEWYQPGKNISIENMPTEFGRISINADSSERQIKFDVSGKIMGADKITLTLPKNLGIKTILVNGKADKSWLGTGEVILPGLPAKILIDK